MAVQFEGVPILYLGSEPGEHQDDGQEPIQSQAASDHAPPSVHIPQEETAISAITHDPDLQSVQARASQSEPFPIQIAGTVGAQDHSFDHDHGFDHEVAALGYESFVVEDAIVGIKLEVAMDEEEGTAWEDAARADAARKDAANGVAANEEAVKHDAAKGQPSSKDIARKNAAPDCDGQDCAAKEDDGAWKDDTRERAAMQDALKERTARKHDAQEDKSSDYSLTCLICSSTVARVPSELKRHYSGRHYRGEIVEICRARKMDPLKCDACDMRHWRPSLSVRHYGAGHGIVMEVASDEVKEQLRKNESVAKRKAKLRKSACTKRRP